MSSVTTSTIVCGASQPPDAAVGVRTDTIGVPGRAARAEAPVRERGAGERARRRRATTSSMRRSRVVARRRTRRPHRRRAAVGRGQLTGAPGDSVDSASRARADRHVADHTRSSARDARLLCSAPVDIAAHLDLALELADRADAITVARFRADDLVVTTKPDLTPVSEADHAVERAIRDRLAALDRVTRCSARSSAPIPGRRGGRRRVPLDHRPDRRHQELRARHPDLGDADRARARRRARAGRRVGARAAHAAGGRASGLGAFRNGERISAVGGRVARRRADLVRVGHQGTLRRRRHRRQDAGASRTAAGGRAASATSGSTCSSPKARSTSRSIRSCRLWDIAALVPIIDEAGGRWSTLDGRADVNGDSFVCTNGLLHDAVHRGARVACADGECPNVTVGIDIGTSSVKAVAADDDGNVVARARIPHDFSVPSPQRFEHDAEVGVARGPAARARGARRREAARGLGRGDGAVAHRGRRRRRARARPACSTATSAATRSERPDQPEQRRADAVPALAGRGSGPTPAGYWMAQAVANHALTGDAGDLDDRRGDRGALVRLDRRMGRRAARVVRRACRAVAGRSTRPGRRSAR